MAGNNYSNYNNYNNRDNRGGGYNQNRGPRQNQGGRNDYRDAPKPIVAKELPTDYVDLAEKVMQTNSRQITTSKLRNLLSQFVDAYNEEILLTGERLQPASVNALTMARIRMLYEAGRDNKVKSFIEAADLLPYLKGIGDSRVKMLNYYHYLEALVAYHKYFGGREN
ncbi:MAG: type III-A CRISPR-associated protein Csm2 [Clostridiales bacterium]|nr:type III-A CRISPR-associated protein Csm2 [Clostridiales bacterium]